MTKRTVFHVVFENDQWKVKKENAHRASSVNGKKEDAVHQAIEQAKKENSSQVIIHKKDNSIQEERTYKNDPYPPEG